jgi:hypothetical protein
VKRADLLVETGSVRFTLSAKAVRTGAAPSIVMIGPTGPVFPAGRSFFPREPT